MTLRRVLLTLGWLIVICGAGAGVWMAWVDESEPPIGGCAVIAPIIALAVALAVVMERIGPPKS